MIAIKTTPELIAELNKTFNGNLTDGQLIVDETQFSKTDVKRLLVLASQGKSDEIQMITRELGTEVALGFTNGRMAMLHRTSYDLHADETAAVETSTEVPAEEPAPAPAVEPAGDPNPGFTVVDVETPFDEGGNPVEVEEPKNPYEEYELPITDEDEDSADDDAAETEVPEETAAPAEADAPAEEEAPQADTVDAPEAEEASEEEPASDEEPAPAEEPPAEAENAPAETLDVDLGDRNYSDAKKAFQDALKGKPIGTTVRMRVKKGEKSGNSTSAWNWVFISGEYDLKKIDVREDSEYVYGKYVLEKPKVHEPVKEEPKPPCEPHKAHKVPPMRPVPETNFTAEEAIAKLEEDSKLFRECGSEDAKWVIEQLKKRCETDRDFVQYVMLPQKTFKDAFEYVFNVAKAKECGTIINEPHGYGVDLSKEASMEFFVEYYMYDEDEVKRLKDEEAAKKKAAAETAQKEQKKAGKKGKKAKAEQAKPDEAKAEVPAFEAIEQAKAAAEAEKAPEPEVKPAEPAPVEEVKAEAAAPAPEPVKAPEKKPTPTVTESQVSIFDLLLA